MKKSRFQQVQEKVEARFQGEQRERILRNMEAEYHKLCHDYDDRFRAMEQHTHNNIFPVVATLRALLSEGMEREQAAGLAGDCFLELMEETAQSIRKLLKAPGLYRAMPWLWKKLMPKLFSEKSGFRFRFYPTDGKRVKFDMLECPYYQICKELDCLDLAPVFCSTDDVCYGHMHPKLLWNRTQTIARGAERCDFDVVVEK